MDLAAVARRQAGAFTRSQVRDAGLTDRQVERRIAEGRWVRLTPSVLVEAATPRTRLTEVWVCVLAAGPGAAIAGVTAAWWWGWADDDGRVHLVAPPGRRRRLPDRALLRRVETQPGAIVQLRGVPVTSKARTLADCLRLLDRSAASAVLDRSQQRAGPSLAAVAACLPHRGAGCAQARSLLAAADGTAFEAERRCARVLRAARVVGWTPNYPVRIGGRRYVLDFAFPELLIAVEIDGFAFHHDPVRFQRDRQRQNALVGAGWLVLRFTWHDLVDQPDLVVADVQAAIRRRESDRG